ncbi:MAG: helix-turn-helix domain-containing protein [Brevirhabdus sp.]
MNEQVDTEEAEGWFSNDSATFGDRMAGAREVLGLSQADLARKLGVKAKTVLAWEEDLAEPRANRLQIMAGVLNVSIMWLLTGEGEGLDGPHSSAEMPADLRQALADLRALRAEMKQLTEKMGAVEKRLRKGLEQS